MQIITKDCKKCGETKALTEYHKSSRTIDGHLGICRACDKLYKAIWKANNPDKSKEYYDNLLKREGKSRYVPPTAEEKRIRDRANQSKWRKADRKKHPEKWKSTAKKLEWQRQDRINNPEKWKAYTKAHYDKHSETLKEKTKQWTKANKEYVAERQKIYGKRKVDELHPNYVLYLLRGKNYPKNIEVPDVLVEAKRLEILIRRSVKNENNN